MRNINNLYLKKKLNEFAAMLKEAKGGPIAKLNKTKARFCLQEGVNSDTAEEYLEVLETSGLITVSSGGKSWKYHPEEEWELFKVTIDKNNGTGGD